MGKQNVVDDSDGFLFDNFLFGDNFRPKFVIGTIYLHPILNEGNIAQN